MSDVTIVNQALHRLGTERINALTDNNKRAKVMSDLYASCRREVLETGGWSFARKRVKLATVVATPDFGYTNQFQLPSDCISVWKENDNREYKQEGRYVLSDEPELNIIYIYDITDDGQYTPLFVRALAIKLAVEASYTLTQDRILRESLLGELTNIYADARCSDSQNSGPDEYVIDDFLNARY